MLYIREMGRIHECGETMKKISETLGFEDVAEFVKFTHFPDSTLRAFKRDRPEQFRVIAYGAYLMKLKESGESVKLYKEFNVPEI